MSFVPFTKNKILTHSRSSSSVLASAAVLVVVQLSLSLCFFVKLFFSKFLIFKSIFLRLCIEKYFLNLFLMRVCVCLLVSVSWWWVVGCYASLFWFIYRDLFYLTISLLWVWVIERSSILTSFVLFKTANALCVFLCKFRGGGVISNQPLSKRWVCYAYLLNSALTTSQPLFSFLLFFSNGSSTTNPRIGTVPSRILAAAALLVLL